MKNILIHGLGQNSKDWDTIKNELETGGISPIVPDLFDLTKGRELDYPTVYPVSYTHLDVYKRQEKCSRDCTERSTEVGRYVQ